jgi:hypothetical protein
LLPVCRRDDDVPLLFEVLLQRRADTFIIVDEKNFHGFVPWILSLIQYLAMPRRGTGQNVNLPAFFGDLILYKTSCRPLLVWANVSTFPGHGRAVMGVSAYSAGC